MEKSPPRRNNKAQSTYINLLCMNQRSGRYLRAKWLLTGGRACFSFTLNLVLSLHVHLSMFIFSRIMHFFCLFSKIQKESFLLPLVWSRFLVFQWLWINTRFDMIQRGGGWRQLERTNPLHLRAPKTLFVRKWREWVGTSRAWERTWVLVECVFYFFLFFPCFLGSVRGGNSA